MREKTRLAFLSLGFDTDLIHKIGQRSLTLSGLKGMNKGALLQNGFSVSETEIIRDKVNRKSIPETNIETLLERCGNSCCYCGDGDSTRPFQIHHMNEYASSRDHGEANLMLVCPTHHVNIHLKKLPVAEQVQQKRTWESLQIIAKEYQSRNISFPFGAFEPVDYLTPGEVTDIFSFGPPKASVCKSISKGTVLNDAIQTLNKNNKIILLFVIRSVVGLIF